MAKGPKSSRWLDARSPQSIPHSRIPREARIGRERNTFPALLGKWPLRNAWKRLGNASGCDVLIPAGILNNILLHGDIIEAMKIYYISVKIRVYTAIFFELR